MGSLLQLAIQALVPWQGVVKPEARKTPQFGMDIVSIRRISSRVITIQKCRNTVSVPDRYLITRCR